MGESTEVLGIARLKFRDGRVDDFKRIAAEVIGRVRAEGGGTLQYDMFLDDDQRECIILERYRDEQALFDHASSLDDVLGQMLATGSISVEILGTPSAEMRARLAGLPLRFFAPFLAK